MKPGNDRPGSAWPRTKDGPPGYIDHLATAPLRCSCEQGLVDAEISLGAEVASRPSCDLMHSFILECEQRFQCHQTRDYNMPKVTIIIPVFNKQRHLSTCLASVTAQTMRDIEIICIDDKSTDESLMLMR